MRQDIFSVGDRVRAMLIGMDEGFSRISLSTAELEATPGDMLFLKVRLSLEHPESSLQGFWLELICVWSRCTL